jgi:hypothetical protein
MKALVAALLAVVSAVLEPASTAIADEIAPPAEYVPPVHFDIVPSESAFARQAIAVARSELEKRLVQTAQFNETVLRNATLVEVQFANPAACQPPTSNGELDPRIVFHVLLDKGATQVLNFFRRDARCPGDDAFKE